MEKMPRFAVVLSGCGRADGSEIHESVTALLAIDTMGCTYDCYAPDIEQAMVVNNITSEIVEERRNVLVESGRIARGNIKPLSEINLNEYDCILFPGGLGAITNWCDFQTKGIACDVDTSISNVLENAYKNNIVIGAMCIAPVVVAKVLGKYNIKVTIGNDKQVADVIRETNAIHENTEVTKACIDTKNKIVTTPAYMLANSISEVAKGANAMVKAMIELARQH